MNPSYFITATGTDIGKTWLTAGLLAACRAQNRPARALKPVMSGYDPARHAESDIGKLGVPPPGADARALPGDEKVDARETGWIFAAALSPDRAAAKEGRTLDFDALVAWCRRRIDAHEDGLLFIEGVGGVMVPLTARHTVREWIVALDIPAILVCGTYLGAISHTLSALSALREAGIVPAMIVVNASAGSTVSIEDTLASLVPHIGSIPFVTLGRDDAAGVAALATRLSTGAL